MLELTCSVTLFVNGVWAHRSHSVFIRNKKRRGENAPTNLTPQ